jgi:hypothetical protein
MIPVIRIFCKHYYYIMEGKEMADMQTNDIDKVMSVTRRSFLPVIVAAALMIICLGAPLRAASAAAPPDGYHPVRIGEGVMAKPGRFAWSPDGGKIVFADKMLEIYETLNGKLKHVDIKPVFVSWLDNDTILVISKKDGRNVLCMVSARSLEVKKVRLDINPDAVFTSTDGKTVLLLETRVRVMFIGTNVGYSLFVYDMRDGTTKKIYDSDIIYPTRQPNIGLLHAWFHAGLDPVGNSLLLMEQVKPPVSTRPFTRVIGIDHLTGRRLPITPRAVRKSYISADWSPDGSMAVLTDSDGHMDIYSLRKGLTYVGDGLYGLYPSWNPRGGLIYLGGWIVDPDGENRKEVLPGCHNSLAEWSPDGTKLAVAAGNNLWLLGPFSPNPGESPDIPGR